MKKGNLIAVFPVFFLGLLVAPAFADGSTVEILSRVLDNFDGTPYVLNEGFLPDGTASNVEHRYTWQAVASKYTTKTADQSFPQVGIVNTAPIALQRAGGPNGGKSLGIQGSFDRRGYNWVDIYPTEADVRTEIPLLGRTRAIDVWVWGANLNYTLEAYIRDNRGMIHIIPLGSLRYIGWKNLRANVPEGIPLVANVMPRGTYDTSFVKFRLWTDPNERTYLGLERDAQGGISKIIPFYVYIAQLKVLTDVFESIYDGDQLGNPRYIEQLWQNTGAEAANNQ
jgi:hypothetical protein